MIKQNGELVILDKTGYMEYQATEQHMDLK
jgi:hypothetical protein